jgi:hypothetical protein
MYKSSSFTFFYKYLFIPILGVVFLFVIATSWKTNDLFLHDWTRGSALLLAWAMIWLIIMMIRLRSVEVRPENLKIKTLQGEKTIDYKDIEWISQIAMINPRMISLKYYDKETAQTKKILIIPDMGSLMYRFNYLAEHEMTKYIRERIIQSKPEYSKENEPSRWLPAGLILLKAIPVILFVNHFFINFQH